MSYQIRRVRSQDLEQLTQIEACCFPAAEAAGREAFAERIAAFPESFFVAEEEDGSLIGFINGAMTARSTICDEMFEDASLHEPTGEYQSIFGLDVLPEKRRQGVAAALMERMIEETQKRGKKGLILTCKDRLLPYYEKFGYRNLGVSASVHGGAVWYDMILEFTDSHEN
ncbi:MAG: GNAT family N-acetyltransferase [bacterium]|nr:GNAT family N-acetyltransferase [bacterium]